MKHMDWKIPANTLLSPQSDLSISQLYHENSKLPPAEAREYFVRQALSVDALSLSTRGFRQYKTSNCSIELDQIIKSSVPLQDVMLRRRSARNLSGALSRAELSTLLFQSLGPSKLVPNEEYGLTQLLRTNPSAGGLYPIDAYVICNNVVDIEVGIYHYNVVLQKLDLLRERSPAELLDKAFYSQAFITEASVVIALAGSFLRTQAKYGERGYRLVLLDAGHTAQNLLLTAEQLGIAAVAVGGFCDDQLAEALDIDGEEEAVIHCVAVGRADEQAIRQEG